MNGRFSGKIAIVAGAASGIGRAIADRFFECRRLRYAGGRISATSRPATSYWSTEA
jgi:NAD(P)-dependent dehydrogenase (short-subunit alcohol dehydrogenase family)